MKNGGTFVRLVWCPSRRRCGQCQGEGSDYYADDKDGNDDDEGAANVCYAMDDKDGNDRSKIIAEHT